MAHFQEIEKILQPHLSKKKAKEVTAQVCGYVIKHLMHSKSNADSCITCWMKDNCGFNERR